MDYALNRSDGVLVRDAEDSVGGNACLSAALTGGAAPHECGVHATAEGSKFRRNRRIISHVDSIRCVIGRPW